MEELIKHFSHELRLFVVDEDEYPKPHRCAVCGLPILSSPSYFCAADCNFFLHKPCAELPEEMFHHHHENTLALERVGDSTSFAYRCKKYGECKFQVHPLVAKPVEIRSKHMSHDPHPLVAFCKEIASVCNGCGEEEKGFFFYCQDCNFWIHENCTVLPIVVKLPNHHPHPYILSYTTPGVPSLHYDYRFYHRFRISDKGFSSSCEICRNPWVLPSSGVYRCAECVVSLAHVACVSSTSSMEILNPESVFIRLPDEEESFPSLSIRKFVERNTQEKTKMEHHGHPLEAVLSDHHMQSVCDVCTQPLHLSSPRYKCHLQDCSFTAHQLCANHLPTSFNMYTSIGTFELLFPHHTESFYFYNPIFRCYTCTRWCNGYSTCSFDGLLQRQFDLECAVAPRIIKHASHKPHLLSQGPNLLGRRVRCCSAGPQLDIKDVYSCVICNFVIHVRCALLPHQHPLHLITAAHDHSHKVQFCDFCEEEIELQWWYYGCHECHHYFTSTAFPL